MKRWEVTRRDLRAVTRHVQMCSCTSCQTVACVAIAFVCICDSGEWLVLVVTSSLSCQPPERKTEDEDWFHGKIGRKEAETMCARDGHYLVRLSGQRGYVLTTKWLLQPKHFIVQTDEEASWCHVTALPVQLHARYSASVYKM